jgi:hypothetical protein
MRRTCLAILFLVTFAACAARADDTRVKDYLETLERAQELSASRDWKAAADLWDRLVSMNPHDAWAWYYLGNARFNSGQYREAVQPYSKALELGAGSLNTNMAYEIARTHGMLRDKEAALEWLQRALDLGFRGRERIRNDEAFLFLKEDVRFLTLAGAFDFKRLSRVEGWRHDLAFVASELDRMHVDPFRKTTREEFEKEVRRLHEDIPRLNDNQTIVRLMGLMRRVGDGHTGCYPDMVSAWSATLPLQFELFPEGLYVIAADSARSDLVGSRVLRFGEHSSEETIRTLEPIISRDNPQGVLRSSVSFLRYPQILQGLGVVPEPDRVALTLATPDGGERTVTVAATPTDPGFNRITGHPSWVTAFESSPGPDPLYLRKRRTPYWFEYLPGQRTVYFQFNSVTDDAAEPLETFVNRLFQFLDANPVEKLIIDMRWNNGGNTRLLSPLIYRMIGHPTLNRPGHLFAIVGRYTYSAGMNAATYMEQQTNVILVGEPTPSSPNFVGESNIQTLPYSGVRVSISDVFWQSSWPTDRRISLAPAIHVPPTFEAYRTKRDPALECILAYQPDD